MNKGILILLVMSVVVFGAILWMASARSAQNGGTPTVQLDATNKAGNAPATGVGANANSAPVPASVQVVSVHASGSGYDHPTIEVKAGDPVEFHFSADYSAGCGSQLILDGFNVNLVSQNGEDKVARFTPTTPGRYPFHCGMNMFRGELDVVA